jgi:hypothetical protein
MMQFVSENAGGYAVSRIHAVIGNVNHKCETLNAMHILLTNQQETRKARTKHLE